jgi:hypothetical protein
VNYFIAGILFVLEHAVLFLLLVVHLVVELLVLA